jgi:hypothetical protein
MHAACTCQVMGGEEYCSEHCREHGQMPGGIGARCECGHPECQGTQSEGMGDL